MITVPVRFAPIRVTVSSTVRSTLSPADNPVRLRCLPWVLLNDPNPPPTWAFFGSSFVPGAPAMLADTTREFVPQRFTFNLGKNEPFPVRLAH